MYSSDVLRSSKSVRLAATWQVSGLMSQSILQVVYQFQIPYFIKICGLLDYSLDCWSFVLHQLIIIQPCASAYMASVNSNTCITAIRLNASSYGSSYWKQSISVWSTFFTYVHYTFLFTVLATQFNPRLSFNYLHQTVSSDLQWQILYSVIVDINSNFVLQLIDWLKNQLTICLYSIEGNSGGGTLW